MTFLAVESLRSASPADWLWLPLRRLMTLRRERNTESDATLLAVSSERGVEPRPEDGGRQLPAESTIADYWLVKPGDIVFNPMWAIGGGVAASSISGAVSPAYRVYTPGPKILPRFAHYYLRCPKVIEQYALVVRGLTTFDRSVTREDFEMMPVPVPPLAVQRTIADYLDAETARIDALIAKKRCMMDLLEARRAALIEEMIRGLVQRYGAIPLKHTVRRVEVGIVITPAAWYSDEGILALRGLNVRPGEIILDDVVKISEEGHRLNQKSELHTGDVVVVRTGQTGTAAVVPESLDGCNCIDLVIVRPSTDLLPKFLEFVLNSDWTQKHVEAYSVGTIQSHFNVAAMKEVPVPAAPLAEQRAAANNLTLVTASLDQLRQKLATQVDLLSERRQVLITAAVTGKLEIPVREAVA